MIQVAYDSRYRDYVKNYNNIIQRLQSLQGKGSGFRLVGSDKIEHVTKFL